MSDKYVKKGQDKSESARQGGSDISTQLTYLLIGGGIGAILALLLAPKSGAELRGDIADVTRKGIDKTREAANYVGDKAGEYYGAVRDKTGEWYGSARETASSDLGGDETKDDYPTV